MTFPRWSKAHIKCASTQISLLNSNKCFSVLVCTLHMQQRTLIFPRRQVKEGILLEVRGVLEKPTARPGLTRESRREMLFQTRLVSELHPARHPHTDELNGSECAHGCPHHAKVTGRRLCNQSCGYSDLSQFPPLM